MTDQSSRMLQDSSPQAWRVLEAAAAEREAGLQEQITALLEGMSERKRLVGEGKELLEQVGVRGCWRQ